MVNAKKDRKFKIAKKQKKQRKRANKTAITLTANKDSDNNLWEKRIPMSNNDHRPHLYDFTNNNPYLIELWDKQEKQDQMDLLQIQRPHLLTLLKDSLGITTHLDEAFPEPPKEMWPSTKPCFSNRCNNTVLPHPKACLAVFNCIR